MNVTMFVWPRREARASDLNTTKDAFRFAFYSPTVFGPKKYKSLPPTIQMMKSFSGWPRTKLFHKNKDHHSSQTKQMIPDIFIVIERRKECWRVWRKWEMPPKQPGALGQLWWPSPASGARHDMWWWCDNETPRWRRPGDRWPEVSIQCSHFHTSTSSPLYPSFSLHTVQYWPINGQD